MDKIRWQPWWRKTKWIGISSWEGPMVTIFGIAIPVALAVEKAAQTTAAASQSHIIVYILAFLLIPIGSLIRKEYLRKIYDPTLALNYQDRFDKMATRRIKAATAILSYLDCKDWDKVEHADEVEDVLDILDDLGLYLHGGQISDRVLHHHFYHWIVLYYQGAQDYIEKERSKPRQRAQWEHIKTMVEVLMETEAVKQGESIDSLWLPDKELREALQDEVDLERDDDATL